MVDHEQAADELTAITDRLQVLVDNFENAKVRHVLTEHAIEQDRLADKAMMICLEGCCIPTVLIAMMAACSAKAGAAHYRQVQSDEKLWSHRGNNIHGLLQMLMKTGRVVP